MKITQELVTVLNGGLQDLIFEIDLLEALERIREGEERTEDELANVDKAVKAVGLTLEDRELELRGILANRLKVDLKDSEQAYEAYGVLANTVNHVVQVDRVVTFMETQGLSKPSLHEIDGMKIHMLNDCLAKLGIDLNIKREME